MKKILTLLFITISLNVMAQSDFDKSTNINTGVVTYKGEFTINDLYQEPTFKWMERGMESYTPDSNKIKYLKKHLSNYRIIVLMGTWCEDSHYLVPKLYKTLIAAGYPAGQLQMFGLDNNKKAKYIEHELYRVEFVPTILVIKGHNEVGRIVETVQKNIETDLMHIIEDDIERNKK